jgi:hypothetical protein
VHRVIQELIGAELFGRSLVSELEHGNPRVEMSNRVQPAAHAAASGWADAMTIFLPADR